MKNQDLLKHQKNEDERRLFYVALTRAKQEVFVTYSETTNTNRRKKENTPMMFLSEISENFVDKNHQFNFDTSKILAKTFIPQYSTPRIENQEKDFLQKILKNFRLSPTALNTYLTCPYQFKLNNLVKVPRAKQAYLSFGTAVHTALEFFYRKYKNEQKLPSTEYLISEFEKAIRKEVLTKSELATQKKKGEKILSNYFDHYRKLFTPALFTEKFFGYGYSKTYLDDIPLSGKVDRIDLVDEYEKTARVVDYKTGKPKSRNFIEGQTQASDGGYKRQLVFYKLLAEVDYNFPLNVVEAELDFVEENASGKLKRERFQITKDEVIDLKLLIKETMKSIRDLNFDRTKEYKNCQFCDFKNHCWGERIPTTP